MVDDEKIKAKTDRESLLKLERRYDSFGMPDWELPFEEIRAKNQQDKNKNIDILIEVKKFMARKIQEIEDAKPPLTAEQRAA